MYVFHAELIWRKIHEIILIETAAAEEKRYRQTEKKNREVLILCTFFCLILHFIIIFNQLRHYQM